MANIDLHTILQLRNDTEANWIAVQDTVIPKKGEACISLDKGKIKIGDGTSTWQALKYINATPEELSASGVQNVVVEGEGNGVANAVFSGGILTITKGSFLTPNPNITPVATESFVKVKYDAKGLVTGSTAVTKADITGLGIPGQDNNTTYTFASGDNNGQIKVTPSDGKAQNINVTGLKSAAYTESTAYDAAGAGAAAAKAVQGDTSNTVKGVEDLANAAQATANAAIPATEKGANNGVATLDGTGKIPSAQLPASVDEIIEAENLDALPEEGEESKIYVTLDDNKTYRWGGSSYVEISASVALGETTGTAYDGAKGAQLRTDLNAHTSNSEIHVTSTDKTNWNGKTTMEEVEAKGYQTAAQVKAIKVDNATHADTADSATGATNDSEGNPINTTYVKTANLSATGNNGVTASFSGSALTVGLNLTDVFILNGGNAAGTWE